MQQENKMPESSKSDGKRRDLKSTSDNVYSEFKIKKLENEIKRIKKENIALRNKNTLALKFISSPIRNSLKLSIARFILKYIPNLNHDRRDKLIKSIEKRDFEYRPHATNLRFNPIPACISDIKSVLPVKIRQKEKDIVDIVICVHNAIDDVKVCLSSIIEFTDHPYRLILVDDGSGNETRDFLKDFSEKNNCTLLRSDTPTGYTFAANRGLIASSANYVLLLNSDTEVTPGWLSKMIDAMERNEKLGIVGPLSNTASWQSVPELLVENDWALNPLPSGCTNLDISRLLSDISFDDPIEAGFINGFCMLVRRDVINEIGTFDEETFGAGYGEENDYCIRARKAGWDLGIIGNAYVRHHQSKSYGNDRRKILAENASKALISKHDPQVYINRSILNLRHNSELCSIREKLNSRIKIDEILNKFIEENDRLFIAFILPVQSAGGGANVIHQEAKAMEALGAKVVIFNWKSNQSAYEAAYPELGLTVKYMDDDIDANRLEDLAGQKINILIATAWFSVRDVDRICPDGTQKAYYIQDYEPDFYSPGSNDYIEAHNTYVNYKDFMHITKTKWNANKISGYSNRPIIITGPSVDTSIFRPIRNKMLSDEGSIKITAMIRPDSPRRSPQLTGQILSEISVQFGVDVEVSCFGADIDTMKSSGIMLDGVRCYGKLSPNEVSILLGDSDIFIDLSEWQAMGLTALEAMASGAAVVMPKFGGAMDFANNEVNAILIDPHDHDEIRRALRMLISNLELRRNMQIEGIKTAERHAAIHSAVKILSAVKKH